MQELLDLIEVAENADILKFSETPIKTEETLFYNVVFMGEKFYGVPKVLGDVDLTNSDERNHAQILSVDTLQELLDLIEVAENADISEFSETPILVKSGGVFNFVLFGDLFYALPIQGKPIYLEKLDTRERSQLLSDSDLEKLEKKVLDQIRHSQDLQLVKSLYGLKIFLFRGHYWVHSEIFHIDKSCAEESFSRSELYSFEALDQAEAMLDTLQHDAELYMELIIGSYSPTPTILFQIHGVEQNFNLVGYQDHKYLIPTSAREIEITNAKEGHRYLISRNQLKRTLIEEADRVQKFNESAEDMFLLGSGHNFNLVTMGGNVFCYLHGVEADAKSAQKQLWLDTKKLEFEFH